MSDSAYLAQRRRSSLSSPETYASSVSRSDRYGSLSTQATSLSAVDEWDKQKDSEEIIMEEEEVSLPQTTRPKGRYSLSDFDIHKTLGTGSFGRVHLGESRALDHFPCIGILSCNVSLLMPCIASIALHRFSCIGLLLMHPFHVADALPQFAANTTCAFTRSRSSARLRS